MNGLSVFGCPFEPIRHRDFAQHSRAERPFHDNIPHRPLLLFVGGTLYGAFVTRVYKPDDRPTPVVRLNDGVDYVPIPFNASLRKH